MHTRTYAQTTVYFELKGTFMPNNISNGPSCTVKFGPTALPNRQAFRWSQNRKTLDGQDKNDGKRKKRRKAPSLWVEFKRGKCLADETKRLKLAMKERN